VRSSVFAAVLLAAAPLVAQSTLIEQGQAALDRDDPRTAVPLLEQAVSQSPQDADAHYTLGCAYGKLALRSNVFRQASLARRTRNEFEQAVSLDPSHVLARFALVQYYVIAPNFFGGSIEKAQLQACEIAKHNRAWGHRASAFIDAHLKNYEAAAEELEAAVALDPDHMPTLYEFGHLAAISGVDLPEGQRSLQKYLAHTPKPGEPSCDEARVWLVKIQEREGTRTR